MKITILLLCTIFGLTAAVYASDGPTADSPYYLPINGSLCLAIGILYRQLIKVNDRLFSVIQDQHHAIKDMTEALKALQCTRNSGS